MRALTLAILTLTTIFSFTTLAVSVPRNTYRPLPKQCKKTVDLLPVESGTIIQDTDSLITGATTPDELFAQSQCGIGSFEIVNTFAACGQRILWWDIEQPQGIYTKYRSFLRYDISDIPKRAIITNVKLIMPCSQGISSDLFNVTLNRCVFTRKMNEINAEANFIRAGWSIDGIDLGIGSELTGDMVQTFDVEIPRHWLLNSGYVDISITSTEEINYIPMNDLETWDDISYAAEHRLDFPLRLTLLFGRPPMDTRPVLQIEYLIR